MWSQSIFRHTHSHLWANKYIKSSMLLEVEEIRRTRGTKVEHMKLHTYYTLRLLSTRGPWSCEVTMPLATPQSLSSSQYVEQIMNIWKKSIWKCAIITIELWTSSILRNMLMWPTIIFFVFYWKYVLHLTQRFFQWLQVFSFPRLLLNKSKMDHCSLFAFSFGLLPDCL